MVGVGQLIKYTIRAQMFVSNWKRHSGLINLNLG